MKEKFEPVRAKTDKKIRLFDGEVKETPTELLSTIIHNRYDTGWFFPAGDPEFWVFKDKLLVPNGKVLDLGMGQGKSSLFFALQGMEVIGYEVDENAIAIMGTIKEAYDLPIEIRDEDIIQAYFGEEEYDTVLCGSTFAHFPSKTSAFHVLGKAVDAIKVGGHIWIRAGGKYDSSFGELKRYVYEYPAEVKKIDDDVYLAPCECSGERKIEPQLFFDLMELLYFIAKNGLKIIHTQIIPEEGKQNIMFGEDFNRSQTKTGLGGMITILAQK